MGKVSQSDSYPIHKQRFRVPIAQSLIPPISRIRAVADYKRRKMANNTSHPNTVGTMSTPSSHDICTGSVHGDSKKLSPFANAVMSGHARFE